jgi:hypothetical protein
MRLCIAWNKRFCGGSSTTAATIRMIYSTLNVCCLGALSGFEKLWTARPLAVEHVSGRGQQETAAAEDPLGALSMSITQGQGRLSANFHVSKLAVVFSEGSLPDSSKESGSRPFHSPMQIWPCRPSLLTLEFIFPAERWIRGSAVIRGSSCC